MTLNRFRAHPGLERTPLPGPGRPRLGRRRHRHHRAATNINTYDEYGVPGTANVGRFQYTGQTWIPEAGLYYYKARFYSPTLGRFLQTDPIGMNDDFNLYAYVGEDPVNGSDPTGLYECVSGPQCDRFEAELKMLRQAMGTKGIRDEQKAAINRVLVAYGQRGEKNGVRVTFAKLTGSALGTTVRQRNGTIAVVIDYQKLDSETKNKNSMLQKKGRRLMVTKDSMFLIFNTIRLKKTSSGVT